MMEWRTVHIWSLMPKSRLVHQTRLKMANINHRHVTTDGYTHSQVLVMHRSIDELI